MAQNKPKPTSLHPISRHDSKPSVDTNASGLAESTISYSAFPEPPSSIPVTPVRSVFGFPGPTFTNTHVPTLARHGSPQPTGSITTTSNRFSRSTFDRDSTRALTSQPGKQDNDVNSVSASSISPYDWHEGSSSIDVDAAEDRLLPTSFITSLLRENAGPRGANRTSFSSDAMSNISEMTYPPKNPYMDSLRDSSALSSHSFPRKQSRRGPLTRPVGGRSPRSLILSGQGQNSEGSDGNTSAMQPLRHSDHVQDLARSSSMLSQATLVSGQSERGGRSKGILPVYSEVDENEEESQTDGQTSSSSGLITSQTNLAQRRPTPKADTDTHPRQSMHSTRSVAPSFTSRISSLRSLKRAFTWRRKPLPSLPTIPRVAVATERGGGREEQAPLPDLVNRANHLHGLLEKGIRPHESVVSFPAKNEHFASSFDISEARSGRESDRRSAYPSKKSRIIAWLRANKPWVIMAAFIIVAVIAIGSGVGVTAQRNKIRSSSCPANRAGVNCSLNATCVCTDSSSQSSSCDNPVGQAILDVVPEMNNIFSTNFTTQMVYTALWIAQGNFQGSNCVGQVNLIDVGPVLDATRQPNRTLWAQSALLWTLTQTQDPAPVSQLRNFVQEAPWSQIPAPDGPTTSDGPAFTVDAAGFAYNFGAQTVSPIPATFVSEGKPQQQQVSRIDASLRPALDNIYSYAVASSTQRDNALFQYWTQTLHQSESRLDAFKAAFNSSPIIVPFDATSKGIQQLYNADSFPPPIACYPGLQPDQLQLVDAVEGAAFGLPKVTATGQFDTSCFPAHPTYGILNLLHLRLPFLDSLGGAAKQGVVLNPDVAPRAILAVGEVLSALPGSTNATRSSTADTDLRNYGTPTYSSHIILQYLSSMPTNTANALVSLVLDAQSPGPPTPPSADDSDLFPLESIPTLEVAVFGSIEASDSSSYVTSFTTSSGALFFGSNNGSALRTWAIGRGGQIAWTENATAPEVVYDHSFSDSVFNSTWLATSIAIQTNATNVGLVNITNTFQLNQRFSP